MTEPAGAARAPLSPGAVHILSIVLGLAAAAFVFWHVERSESTDCFEKSVEITIAGSDVLEGCDLNAFEAVRAFISEQREPRAADEPPPEETDQVAARSALIVWLVLFAATAGFATVVAAHSSAMLYDLASTKCSTTMTFRRLPARGPPPVSEPRSQMGSSRYRPPVPRDIARAAAWMTSQPSGLTSTISNGRSGAECAPW